MLMSIFHCVLSFPWSVVEWGGGCWSDYRPFVSLLIVDSATVEASWSSAFEFRCGKDAFRLGESAISAFHSI